MRFCTECGTEQKDVSTYCTSCGKKNSAEDVSPELQVISAILNYVAKEWSDFEDFVQQEAQGFELAKEISNGKLVQLSAANNDLLINVFGIFLESGGFSKSTRFDSLESFIREMG